MFQTMQRPVLLIELIFFQEIENLLISAKQNYIFIARGFEKRKGEDWFRSYESAGSMPFELFLHPPLSILLEWS
jgi:hypothetical protein